MLLFSWHELTGLVRAEFLRGRNLEYVRAADDVFSLAVVVEQGGAFDLGRLSGGVLRPLAEFDHQMPPQMRY